MNWPQKTFLIILCSWLVNVDCNSSFVSTQIEDNLSSLFVLAQCLHLLVCVPVLSDTAVTDNTNCTISKCNPAGWNVFYLRRQWKINVFLVLFSSHKNIETILNFVGNLFTFNSESAFRHDPLTTFNQIVSVKKLCSQNVAFLKVFLRMTKKVTWWRVILIKTFINFKTLLEILY